MGSEQSHITHAPSGFGTKWSDRVRNASAALPPRGRDAKQVPLSEAQSPQVRQTPASSPPKATVPPDWLGWLGGGELEGVEAGVAEEEADHDWLVQEGDEVGVVAPVDGDIEAVDGLG